MKKTAIITGASGNLGQAVVKKFLEEGYQVIGTVAPGSKKNFLKHERLEVVAVNLSNEEESGRLVQSIIKKYGEISAVLLLAGGFSFGGIAETGRKELQKMIELNFLTAYFTARRVFQQMLKQEYGRLIFIGSKPALEPKSGKNTLPYAISKSMLFHFSELLNAEGNNKNVVSVLVAPSIIDTPENRKNMPDADFTKWVKAQEIAEVIAFACSDEAKPLRNPIFKIFGES